MGVDTVVTPVAAVATVVTPVVGVATVVILVVAVATVVNPVVGVATVVGVAAVVEVAYLYCDSSCGSSHCCGLENTIHN